MYTTMLSLAALCALLPGLAACRKNPRDGRLAAGECVINIGADPRTLDPSLATDIASAQIIAAFERGAAVLDAKGVPHPDLATTWTVSRDNRIFDFRLRPQKWSNGLPIVAGDYVYAWTQRMLNPKFGAEYVDMMFYVKGARTFYEHPELGAGTVAVSAPAPDHLHVELENPAPFFLQLMAHQAYFPVCEAADRKDPNWAKRTETYVGSGPYVMKEWRPGAAIIAAPNPNYWNAANIHMRRVTFRFIEAESTARIDLDTGDIDAMDTVPRQEMEALRGTPELRFSAMLSTYILYLNCKHKPLDDARVRRALGLAVDRTAITESVTRAGEQPAFFYTPPKLYPNPPKPLFKDADYAGARQLLAEAGYPGGKGFPELHYIYNTNESHKKIAEVLQETWRQELGIRLSVENQEFKVVVDNRRTGNFDIARGGWVADFADPVSFLGTMISESQTNDAHWSDPKFDALFEQAKHEPDAARRLGILASADEYLMTQMPIVPIYTYTNPYLCTPRLKGYELGLMGLFDPARLEWGAP